jgi:hypothetical protein
MKKLILLLSVLPFLLEGTVVSRSDVISNAQLFCFLGWVVNTPNEKYWIYSTPGWAIVGEAYSYGDKATPATFRSEIAAGLKPRNWMASPHVPANPVEEYTGTDCSGFVTRCLGFPESYVNSTNADDIYIYALAVDSPKEGDIGWVPGHVFIEAGEGMMYESNPREVPAGGNRVQFQARLNGETFSIFPNFEDPHPEDGEVVDNCETVNLSITVRATGILYNNGVSLFVNGENIKDFTVSQQGADKWEIRKENFDVSEGEKFTVRVIAENDIVSNRYRDEYTWSFMVNAPPIVRSTDPSDGATNVPVDKSPIKITFSKAMEQAATERAVSIVSEKDDTISFTPSWKDTVTLELAISDTLEYCMEYTSLTAIGLQLAAFENNIVYFHNSDIYDNFKYI